MYWIHVIHVTTQNDLSNDSKLDLEQENWVNTFIGLHARPVQHKRLFQLYDSEGVPNFFTLLDPHSDSLRLGIFLVN